MLSNGLSTLGLLGPVLMVTPGSVACHTHSSLPCTPPHETEALTEPPVHLACVLQAPTALLFTSHVCSTAPPLAGDINYVLRFHNTDKGVVVEDLQNNNVSLSKPVIINSASIIVIDRVLMSGEHSLGSWCAFLYSKPCCC